MVVILVLGNQILSIMDSGHMNLLKLHIWSFKTDNSQNCKGVKQLSQPARGQESTGRRCGPLPRGSLGGECDQGGGQHWRTAAA